MTDNTKMDSAREFAWNWFEFHASQRLTVFKFFMTAVGALIGAFGALVLAANLRAALILPVVAGLTIFTSLAFRRLDMRTTELTKLAEAYLRFDQDNLAKDIGSDAILLLKSAEKKEYGGSKMTGFYSFSEVNQTIFNVVIVIGGLELLYSVFEIFLRIPAAVAK